MSGGDLKSLKRVARSIERTLPAADPAALIVGSFGLPEGQLYAAKRGDALCLYSGDKMVRCALRGMEGHILSYLASKGHGELRRVVWSAE